jgi:hypothetical protein
MTPRPLLCRGVKSDAVLPIVGGKQAELKDSKNPNSKNQAKKAEKQRLAEAKKAQKSHEKEEVEKQRLSSKKGTEEEAKASATTT